MTCDHARCHEPATIRCRMGDGWIILPGYRKRQTFAYYCPAHFRTVDRLFRLCDIAPLDTVAANRIPHAA